MKRFFALFAALMTALLLGTGTAAAHSVALSSNPEDGSEIAQAPSTVSVTFNENINEEFAALTVTGPDGSRWSDGDPTVSGPTVSIDLAGLGPVGEYTIAFRVTSADGHPVSGTRTFTLTEEGTGTPVATADEADAADGSGDGGPQVWWFIVAGVIVVAGGLWFALRKPKA